MQQNVRGAPLLHVHSIGLLSQAICLNTVFNFGAHLGIRGDGLVMQSAAAEIDRTKEQLRTAQQRRRRKRFLRRMQMTLQRAILYSRCVNFHFNDRGHDHIISLGAMSAKMKNGQVKVTHVLAMRSQLSAAESFTPRLLTISKVPVSCNNANKQFKQSA